MGDLVATWADVKNYITSNYIIQNDNGNSLSLLFNIGDNRSQLVFVMGIDGAGDMSSARFFSPFANRADISPAQFANLAEDAVFGLAALGDYYGVVHNAFLANIDSTEIDTPMTAVTSFADQIEKRLGLGDAL